MNLSTSQEKSMSTSNRENDRQKALKILEKAKAIKRKVVFLPKGATGGLKIKDVF